MMDIRIMKLYISWAAFYSTETDIAIFIMIQFIFLLYWSILINWASERKYVNT